MKFPGFDGRIRIFQNQPFVKIVASQLTKDKVTEEAFYICDLGDILKKHEEWISQLPRVRPYYAVKCNDSPLVLQTLAGLGTGFDCASKMEIKKVKKLGVNASDIIFANPTKQNSHIQAAVEYGVATMTFDNEGELFKIKHLYPNARLVVRIRCDAEKAQCQLGMKFGVLVEEAPALLTAAKELDLDVVGVSFHVGSGCMDPPVFDRAIMSAKWLFEIGQEIGYNMRLLDIGGGFPGNIGTLFHEMAQVINGSLDSHFPEGCGVDIIAEPGRFYVASAFTLYTLVHSIRELKGEDESKNKYMYYINDGVYGSFNDVISYNGVFHPHPVREYENEDEFESSIWGPSCDGIDQVCPYEKLPKLELGDWLQFSDMGAYSLVMCSPFNGFPVPTVCYIASFDSWYVCACRWILKEFMTPEQFVCDEAVPLMIQAEVCRSRDAFGMPSKVATTGAIGRSTYFLEGLRRIIRLCASTFVWDPNFFPYNSPVTVLVNKITKFRKQE